MPLALTPKSVCGSDAAQSCDGCAAVWMTSSRRPPTRCEQRGRRPSASRMSRSTRAELSGNSLRAAARSCVPSTPRARRNARACRSRRRSRRSRRARSGATASDPIRPAGPRDDDGRHELRANRVQVMRSRGSPRARRVPPAVPRRTAARSTSTPPAPRGPRRVPAGAASSHWRMPTSALAGDQEADGGHPPLASGSLSRGERGTRPRRRPTRARSRSWSGAGRPSRACPAGPPIRSTKSPVPAPPACGPAAVTIVPPVNDASRAPAAGASTRSRLVTRAAAARRARTSPARRAPRTRSAAASRAGSA